MARSVLPSLRRRLGQVLPGRIASISSIEDGQSDFRSRDRARSFKTFPPVWQRAQ